MTSIDLKKTYRDHYTATRAPTIIDVPTRPFLMIDGSGDPNTATEYRDAIEALYPIAYGIRAAIKETTGDAYTVMPLEALWWVPDMSEFDPTDKSSWFWTAMICLPDAVTEEMAADVISSATAKKQLAAGSKARVEHFTEGLAAQILHIGPYDEEGPIIEELHQFVDERGYRLTGKHHEIYLSDSRRTEPAKLRTILRQPCTGE